MLWSASCCMYVADGGDGVGELENIPELSLAGIRITIGVCGEASTVQPKSLVSSHHQPPIS